MPPKSGFVLDCSIALAWYFADEKDAFVDAVQTRLSQIAAVVPSLWPLELTNALVVGERRGRATVAQATKWLSLLRALPIQVDGQTANRAWADTIQLARAHDLSTYDASYLELALRLGHPLATLDKKLRSVAIATGVPLFKAKP